MVIGDDMNQDFSDAINFINLKDFLLFLNLKSSDWKHFFRWIGYWYLLDILNFKATGLN